MKYLSDYTEQANSELFEKTGAFFAFGNKQFEEQKKDGVKYVSLGAGLICPKGKAKEIFKGLDESRKKGIELDLKENGKENIIRRELGNHETQITMDCSTVIDVLKDYGISEIEIKAGFQFFYQECVKNDWF